MTSVRSVSKHRPNSSQVLLATTGIIIKAHEWPSVHIMTQKRLLEYDDVKEARGPDTINLKGNCAPYNLAQSFVFSKEASVTFGDSVNSRFCAWVGVAADWCVSSSDPSPLMMGRDAGVVELLSDVGSWSPPPSPEGVEGSEGSSFEGALIDGSSSSSSSSSSFVALI